MTATCDPLIRVASGQVWAATSGYPDARAALACARRNGLHVAEVDYTINSPSRLSTGCQELILFYGTVQGSQLCALAVANTSGGIVYYRQN